MSESSLNLAVIRILRDDPSTPQPVGSGFLVSPRHIFTCAHVVNDALGLPWDTSEPPAASVHLDFPLCGSDSLHRASVLKWYPVKENTSSEEIEDIAVLELVDDSPLPTDAHPVSIVVLDNNAFFDREVRMCGFPAGMDDGDWVSGKLQGSIRTGWVQLDNEVGRRSVASGFSGTAVWDKLENAVAGMMVSINTRDGDTSAYMIPVSTLVKAWPELDQHSRLPNPYRGLQAFREDDAPYFFGREEVIEESLGAVQEYPFVSVIGASGSGKSSLVFAGLVPRLREDDRWLIAHFRPKNQPFNEMAWTLIPLLYDDKIEQAKKVKSLASDLDSGEIGLSEIVHLITEAHPEKRLLLIVDQFEELYTLNPDKALQRRFVDRLLEVGAGITPTANDSSMKFTVLMTMRADFMGRALAYGPFASTLNTFPNSMLGPMTEAGLKAAIEKPAQKLKVELEPGLAERILADLGQEPGNLPLLEFALTQLWERQTQSRLTHAAYEAIGGVNEALTNHADEICARFTAEQQEQVRQIFVQLVRPGEDTEHTRQVATYEQVGAEKWPLAVQLADARLVVTGRDEETGQETVEVVHEALIRNWTRLKLWVNADREFLLWRQRLRAGVEEWQRTELDEGSLLRGASLTEAERWLENRSDDLTPDELGFIHGSIALREQGRIARKQLQRRITLGLAGGLLVALILAGLAGLQWQRAEKQHQIALARQLAAQSEFTRNKHPARLEESVLLAVQAMQLSYTVEAEEALRHGLALLPHPILEHSHKKSVNAIAASEDGRYFATGSSDHSAVVWDIETGQEILRVAHEDAVTAVSLHPQAKYLATGGRDGRAVLWRLPTGEEVYSVKNKLIEKEFEPLRSGKIHREQQPAEVTSLAFSRDGQYLAIASEDGTIRLIDIPSLELQFTLTVDSAANDVTFSLDGKFLAARSGRNMLIWDMATGKEKRRIEIHNGADHLEFDPMGRYLATANTDNTSTLWDIETGQRVRDFAHESRVSQVGFSPDGKSLWTASADDTVRRWDITTGREMFRIQHGGWVRLLAISSDGKYIATADFGDMARLWEAADGSEVARFSHESQISSYTFINGSKYLAMASIDGTTRVWKFQGVNPVASLKHPDGVKKIAFSEDGTLLVTTADSLRGDATTWKIPGGEKVHYTRFPGIGSDIAISHDGKHFMTTASDMVWLRDMETAKIVAEIKLEDVNLQGGYSMGMVAFSPNGRYLVKEINGRTLLWQIANGSGAMRMELPDYIYHAAFSPNSLHLVAVGRSKSPLNSVVEVLELEGGHKVTSWEYPGSIHFFAVSHDGEYLAMPNTDITRDWNIWEGQTSFNIPGSAAIVMKLKDGKEIARVNFPNQLNALAFSPDGNYLVGGLADGTASVFNIRSVEEIARVDHQSQINQVLFSPTQTYIATAGEDDFVRLWLWRHEDLIEEACSRLTRNFTVDEWKRYFGDEPYELTCKDLPPHPSLIEEGQKLAQLGDTDGGAAIFEHAIELGASVDKDPKDWARELAASGLIEWGVKWAKRGAITEALATFSQAQQLNPTVEISFADWNELCWQGALQNMPSEVMHACEHAVELAPENEKGAVRDSRGLARALIGDYKGAIEDFQFYIEWGKDERSQEALDQRRNWIRELKAAQNPFNATTLEKLRSK